MRSERGQASLEWTGLVLLMALALAALPAVGFGVDGRSFGGFLAHRIVCAVKGGCDDGHAQLARAYGSRDAELVRRLAPGLVYEKGERQLPVDYRRCRSVRCAEAPDDRDLDVHRTDSGQRATVFVRRIRRGGRLYIQYWLYYPDSDSSFAGSAKLWRSTALRFWRYPGYHPDDWEAVHLRVERNGQVYARSTAHGHYQSCKQERCKNTWARNTGWSRVSRGSHAGHIPFEISLPWRHPGKASGWKPRLRARLPGRDMRERTTTAEGIRLIPLERVKRGDYRALDRGIKPPWKKKAYRDPETGES